MQAPSPLQTFDTIVPVAPGDTVLQFSSATVPKKGSERDPPLTKTPKSQCMDGFPWGPGIMPVLQHRVYTRRLFLTLFPGNQ